MKNLLSLFLILIAFTGFGQVTTIPAEYNDPSTELTIIIDLNQLDQSADFVQNLIADADAGLDIHIWTWKPAEHPVGHPLVNGTGAQPWKSSNEALKLTRISDRVYSYTMIPTQFYAVSASTVFTEDIHFLIKPTDGGGFGDPDRKSPDLLIPIDPPDLDRPIVYSFPLTVLQDDIITVVYDNFRETVVGMQNLAADNCTVFLEALLESGGILRPSPFLQAGTNPTLKMTYKGDGVFEKVLIPGRFFEVPAGDRILQITAVAMKSNLSASNIQDDRTATNLVIEIDCE